MNLRIKLRKTQSLVPTEKLVPEIGSLEILGDNIEKLPGLAHLKNCRSLSLNCPELKELPSLPENLVILKIKSGQFKTAGLPSKLEILKLSNLALESLSGIDQWPESLKNLDLSYNLLTTLPEELLNLSKLNRVSLDSNKFENLPEKIYELKSLNHLSLDNNPLVEEEKVKLHRRLGIWF